MLEVLWIAHKKIQHRAIRVTLLFSLIASLSGCSSLSPPLNEKYTFDSNNAKGLVALLDVRIRKSSNILLREVDLQRGHFTENTQLLNQRTSVKTPAYHLMQIPAGNYALVSIQTSSVIGLTRIWNTRCNGPILEVFYISSGKVNSVEVRKLKPGSSIASPVLKEILQKYPRISAPIGQAELVGYIDARGIKCEDLPQHKNKLKISKVKPNYT